MKYKKGDLLEAFDNGEVDTIMHQENCEGLNYFAGIAKAIHNKFKGLTEKHIEHCKNPHVFGSPLIFETEKGSVINLYSQLFRGSPSNRAEETYTETTYADTFQNRLLALKTALQSINTYLKHKKIGIPLIGGGHGASKELKGSMTDLEYFKMYIAPIIESVFDNTYDLTVYYL